MKLLGTAILTAMLWMPWVRSENQVQITGNDQMLYNVTRFEAKAGEPVRLTFVNVGKLPKEAMGHNLVILKSGENPQEVAQAGLTFPQFDYIAPTMKEKIVAHTRMLGPGEVDTIAFNAPKDPGEYPYLCTFPGHYLVMRGVMVVNP